MYPSHPSRKALVKFIVIGVLASAVFVSLKFGIIPARAFFTGGRQSAISAQNVVDATSTIDIRISAANDDAEQRVSDGFMYLDSSDLELVNDPGVTKGIQSVGMLFKGITIPRGSAITQAYIEFTVDETSSETTSLVFYGQAADNPGTFTTSAYNVSSRAKTGASVSWNSIPAWNSVGAKVQSPDVAAIIQEIVNRGGWAQGNSLAFIVDGSGRRVSTAYEAGASNAPLLHIAFLPPGSTAVPTALPTIPVITSTPTAMPPTQPVNPTTTTIPPSPTKTPVTTSQTGVIDARVAVGADDVEQRVSDGLMYLDSTDLELVNDPGVTKGIQSVGMRFTGVGIPRGSTILQAYIEFQVDETSSEATSLVFRGQAADNAGAFTTAAFNVSGRYKTSNSISWNNITAWNSVGVKVQSPDITNIIQEIVSRPGWMSGNSLVIIVDGSGRRVARAYESGAQTAALLHVSYSSNGAAPTPTGVAPTATRTPTSTGLPPTPTRTPMPTNTSTPNPQPTPVGQTGNWTMIFDDEFNGTSLDSTKWRTCFWWADTTCSIETNHELELYNPQDVLVQNGLLRLRAQHRDMVAWNGVTYHYTSGMVMTGGRNGQIPPEFQFKYGYAEALVKVPAGQGLWPAFWMLPTSYSSRPEIDIMEILGHQTTQYHMNYHFVGGDVGSTWTGPDFAAGWHVIGLDWEPNAIVWYVDGVERWRYTDTAHISSQPEYLLLNLAVGGDWPGPPNSNTPFPSYFEVEYVRVWQR